MKRFEFLDLVVNLEIAILAFDARSDRRDGVHRIRTRFKPAISGTDRRDVGSDVQKETTIYDLPQEEIAILVKSSQEGAMIPT